jgi:Mg-chelatase subunit ChlD
MQNYSVSKNNGNFYPIVAKATVVALPCPTMPALKKKNPHQMKDAMEHARQDLKAQGFTNGLIESLTRSNDAFPLRIWVVDNSGSMTTPDGHRLYQTPDNRVRLLDCSRWAEIQNTVKYHARVAALLEAPTSFRLLNPTYGKQQFGVAERGPEHTQEDLRNVLSCISDISPSGVTPLTARVVEIVSYLESIKHELFAKCQKVVIVLATDGLPSDNHGMSSTYTMNEFKNALRSLEGLPIWLVIRLCTDDDEVVDFYNNIDSQLEMSLDVLDDFRAEALEVYEHNKWLNYALPLHRMREMGFYHKLFDLIDERSLTRDELKDFFLLIYGVDALDGLPDPQIDWPRFLDRIAMVTNAEKPQWNPVKRRMMPWIDIRRLDRKYGNHPTCSFW